MSMNVFPPVNVFLITTLAAVQYPGDNSQSHLPQQRQHVITLSIVCQGDQRKSLYLLISC